MQPLPTLPGRGRQRYDFTDATVSVQGTVASSDDPNYIEGVVSTGGGGGGGGPSGPVLVELVEVQFRGLRDGLADMARAMRGMATTARTNVPTVMPAPATNTLGLREVQLVELEATQYAGILAAAGGAGGRNVPTVFPVRNRATPMYQGGSFLERLTQSARFSDRGKEIANRFRRAGRGLKRTGQLLTGTQSGGLIGRAGAAGGPAGIAIVGAITVAQKVFDGMAEAAKLTTMAIRGLGDAAMKIARNDGLGALAGGIDAAAGALGKIPLVGGALAAGLQTVSTGLNVFKGVLDAFTGRARELAQYNPQIAVAEAMSDVRRMFADMREANRMASRYADLLVKQQQMDEKIQEALLPLKEVAVSLLQIVVPLIGNIAEGIGNLVGMQLDANKLAQAQLAQYSDDTLRRMAEMEENKEHRKLIQDEIKRREQREIEDRAAQNMQFDLIDSALDAMTIEGNVSNFGDDANRLRFPLLRPAEFKF